MAETMAASNVVATPYQDLSNIEGQPLPHPGESVIDVNEPVDTVDDILYQTTTPSQPPETGTQDVNKMALALEAATQGKLTYEDAYQRLMADGGFSSQTIREHAAALYVRQMQDQKEMFNATASQGMVIEAERHARYIDQLAAATQDAPKEKDVTTITKEATTNLATSNPTTLENNDPNKIMWVAQDVASQAGMSEVFEKLLVARGLAVDRAAFVGTLGMAIMGPIGVGMVAGGIPGLVAGIGVGSKFSYDAFVTIPNALEQVGGVKKRAGASYAEQINEWRQKLAGMTQEDALKNIIAVFDYIVSKETLPGDVGKVFNVMNVMRLVDAFDVTDWKTFSLSLKTQEFLDRLGLGLDAAGALKLVGKAFSTAKVASKTIGAAETGKVLGKDIVNGTNKMGIDNADQVGYTLSADLKQYLPDGVTGMSAKAQAELETTLTKTLDTLNERIRLAEDPEAVKTKDFLTRYTEKYSKSIVSANLDTNELIVQHPSGSPFRNKGNAIAYAKTLSDNTGLKWDVVNANDDVTTKLSRFNFGEVVDDIDNNLSTLFQEGKTGLFDPFGPGRLTAQSIAETISTSKAASKDQKELAKLLAKIPALDNVQVKTFSSPQELAKALGMTELDEAKIYQGKYHWKNNTIYLHEDLASSRSLALHETLHAAISQVIDVVRVGGPKARKAAGIRPEQIAAVENLREIYKDVTSQISQKVANGELSHGYGDAYGFYDVHEMISEGLTNRNFIELLKETQLSKEAIDLIRQNDSMIGVLKNAWDAFTKVFLRALGMTPKQADAYSLFVEQSARLIKSVDADQQMLVNRLSKQGISTERMTEIFETSLKEAAPLAHGWYVKHTGAPMVHTSDEITSRFGLGLDPLHRASDLAVHDRFIVLAQEQKDRRAITELLKSGFKGLSSKQHERVISVLEEGDTLGKDFGVPELIARGLTTDKEQRAYMTYRTVSNLDLAIKNSTIKENLTRRGFTQGYIKDGLITHFAPAKVVTIADNEGRLAYNTISKTQERISAAKHTGLNVIDLAKPVIINGQEYTRIIGDSSTVSFGRLRNQVPNAPGTFRRYYTQDYFGDVKINRLVNGEIIEDTLHLRTSNSGKDIIKWSEGMNRLLKMYKSNPASITHSIVESELGRFEDAADVMQAINRGEWDNYVSFGNHYDRSSDAYLDTLAKAQWDDDLYKREGRGIRLRSIDSDKNNILDPIKAIQAEISNVARHRNIDEWRDKWVQTWWNTFSNTLPDALKNKYKSPLAVMSDPSLQLSTYTKGDQLGKFAESQRKYILSQLGVKTLDERLIESAMKRFTSSFSEDAKIAGIEVGDKLLTAGHALRNADPLQFVRSFNFFTMLAAFNPAQLIVQSAGAINAIAVSPLHGAKAAFTAPLLRVALMSDNPQVWNKVATLEKMATLGMSNTQEFVSTVAAIRRSGLLDGIVATSMHSAETGRFNLFTGMANKLGEKTAFFFNRGEEFTRLVAFDVARRDWIAAHPNAVWTTDAALRDILSRTDDLTQNMTRANLAFYQRGAVSIPGQFLQYNIKLGANIIGAGASWAKSIATGKPPVYRGYSMDEATRILAFHIAAYGLAGNGLMSLYDEVTGGYEKIVGRQVTDDEKLAISQGAIASLINEMSQSATGQDLKLAVGSRLGAFEWYEKTAKTMMQGNSDFWSVVLGPSYGSVTRLGAMKALVAPLVRQDLSASAFIDAFNSVGKEVFSGWKNISKAYYAQLHDGQLVSKDNTVQVTLSKPEIIAQAIGIGSSAYEEYWRLKLSISERRKAIQEFAKTYLEVEKTSLEVLKNEGESKRYKALTDYMTTLHSPLPSGERDYFWQLVKKPTGVYATAPFIDAQTKIRAEYLEGSWNLKDVVTTRSRGLTESKPLENK